MLYKLSLTYTIQKSNCMTSKPMAVMDLSSGSSLLRRGSLADSELYQYYGVHPVRIARFHVTPFSPRIGLPRNPLCYRQWLRCSKGWFQKDENLITRIGCIILDMGMAYTQTVSVVSYGVVQYWVQQYNSTNICSIILGYRYDICMDIHTHTPANNNSNNNTTTTTTTTTTTNNNNNKHNHTNTNTVSYDSIHISYANATQTYDCVHLSTQMSYKCSWAWAWV